MIANAISQYENQISASKLWNLIKDSIDGTPDERKPHEYPPSDYGTIYINTITDIICDKFGSKRKRKEKEISLYLIQKSIVRW